MGPNFEGCFGDEPIEKETLKSNRPSNTVQFEQLEMFKAACQAKDPRSLIAFVKNNKVFLKMNLTNAVLAASACGNRYALALLRINECFENRRKEEIFDLLLCTINTRENECIKFFLEYLIELDSNFLLNKLEGIAFSLIKSDNTCVLEFLKTYFGHCTQKTLLSFLTLASENTKSNSFNFFLNYLIEVDPIGIKNNLRWIIEAAITCENVSALESLKKHKYLENCTKKEISKFSSMAIDLNRLSCSNFFLENFDFQKPIENLSDNGQISPPSKLRRRSRILSRNLSEKLKFGSGTNREYRKSLGMPDIHEENSSSPKLSRRSMSVEKVKEETHNDLRAMIDDPDSLSKITSLLASGVKPNESFEDGTTLLLHASRLGDQKLVAKLLTFGADPNWIDLNGNSALMYAASSISLECIKKLLEDNANPLHTNNNGQTALSILAGIDEKILCSKIKAKCSGNSTERSFGGKQPLKRKFRREKAKEPIESESSFEEANKMQILSAYLTSLDGIDHPLTSLLQNLESKKQEVRSDKPSREPKFLKLMSEDNPAMNSSAAKYLKILMQQEMNKIYNCCTLILEKNPEIYQISNGKGSKSLVTTALENNNSGAIKALIPYASEEEKTEMVAWAEKNNNIALKNLLK